MDWKTVQFRELSVGDHLTLWPPDESNISSSTRWVKIDDEQAQRLGSDPPELREFDPEESVKKLIYPQTTKSHGIFKELGESLDSPT
jgi:hypothetical protein